VITEDEDDTEQTFNQILESSRRKGLIILALTVLATTCYVAVALVIFINMWRVPAAIMDRLLF